MRIVVQPAADGIDMRRSWTVKAGGTTSNHTKKSAAKRKARELANDGDTLVVKGTDGRIQSGYPRTYRGSTPASGGSDSPDSSEFGFRDPVEGEDMIGSDFDDNQDDADDALDDLF